MENVTNDGRKYMVSGQRLKEYRKAFGLTQEELAERILALPDNKRTARSEKTIGRMERGEIAISAEYAYLLSQIFGCNPQWLRGYSDIKTSEEGKQLTIDTVRGMWHANSGKKSGEIGIIVGGHIKRYRAMRKMTVERLSDATGISVDTIISYEENAELATAKELDSICKALNIKVAMLYGQLPPPEDVAQWRIDFSDGDSVGGPIQFVVSKILERLNSSGHEAALCMLRGLVETPYFQRQKSEVEEDG